MKRIRADRHGAVGEAAKVLRTGGVVAFPTETVYGLGVRYGDRSARDRLRQIKGRDAAKPFQCLVSSRSRAEALCPDMPGMARRLARAFWPGPLTLVVKSRNGRWLGLRVPEHPVALRLIRASGGVIVATSANRSGEPPARTADAAAKRLGDKVDLILDGGKARMGRASSVVRVAADGWEALREGALSRRRISMICGEASRKENAGT